MVEEWKKFWHISIAREMKRTVPSTDQPRAADMHIFPQLVNGLNQRNSAAASNPYQMTLNLPPSKAYSTRLRGNLEIQASEG